MKYFVNLLFLVSFWNCFSQNSYPTEPAAYKKIHFVYEERSNYFLNDSGVYADTLLLSFNFPNLKFTKVKSPVESNTICGFIPYADFVGEDKRRIVGQLYHDFQIFECTYDVKKQQTKIKVIRDNKEIRTLVKKYFNDHNFPRLTYKIEVDYKNGKDIYTTYYGNNETKAIMYDIVYDDKTQSSGYFKRVSHDNTYTYTVSLNNKLNNKITPVYFFTNSENGIEKLDAFFHTYELKSVTYE